MKTVLLLILLAHSIHAIENQLNTLPVASQWIASHDCSIRSTVSRYIRNKYLSIAKLVQVGNLCISMFEDKTQTKISEFKVPTIKILANGNKKKHVVVFEKDQAVQIATESWGLDRIDQATLPLDNHAFQLNYTGAGVTIYMLDTGIYEKHQEFTNRVKVGGHFVNEKTTTDGHGHGTHTAGTAAGSSYGIARGAEIVSVKVLSSAGIGTNGGVIEGIEWVLKNITKPSVLSMSFVSKNFTITNKVLKAASDAGIVVVVAAGNNNSDACAYSPAGAGGKGAVITVAATDKRDYRASFSNYGACVDIFAPGTNITSAWLGLTNASNTISGTSMATPHVAGVMAVLLEESKGNKSMAMKKLFEIAAKDEVIDPRGSPNRLLQSPVYSGVPTPAPTYEITTPQPTLVRNMCVGSICITNFTTSNYCNKCDDTLTVLQKTIVNASTLLCTRTFANAYKNKVVFVENSGKCSFYSKTMNAANAGAFAVVMYQSSEVLQTPVSTLQAPIQTYMISRSDVRSFWQNTTNRTWMIGDKDSKSSSPTTKPTTKPTRMPTRKNKKNRG